ncbi:GAF and ANTAR domain-containing protein [Pseudokineococcus basanitobsidens]|uniref:GAF and ANTAR domain-containing protein n=1 Tax=Pseudokineococcus basanitobsidens TaxID=1926649 RepID=A0ABU8RLB8_9ACTN
MPEHDEDVGGASSSPGVREAARAATGQGARADAVVPETRVARLVAATVGAERVAVTLTSGSDHRSVVRGSDPVLVALADREQSVGQGPTVDVLASGRALSVPDLHAGMERWPVLLTTHASSLDLRSLLVVPLDGPPGRAAAADDVGGVLVLARQDVRPFTTVDEVVADRLAALLSVMLQARALDDSGQGDAGSGNRLDEALDPASQVLPLAVGRLMVSDDLSEEDALLRLEARAFASGTSVYDVARDVVTTDPPHQRAEGRPSPTPAPVEVAGEDGPGGGRDEDRGPADDR